MADPLHPDVPPRTMGEDATVLHEIYLSLVTAGFDRSEALVLVGFVMVGGRDAMQMVNRLLGEGE